MSVRRTQQPSPPTRGDELRARLAAIVAGLPWTSEIDAAIQVAYAPSDAGTLDDTMVTRLAGAGGRVERRSLDEVFRGHIEDVDPADAASQATVPRYRSLRETLRTLDEVAAYRVGDGPELRLLVAGRTTDGALVGIVTRLLET